MRETRHTTKPSHWATYDAHLAADDRDAYNAQGLPAPASKRRVCFPVASGGPHKIRAHKAKATPPRCRLRERSWSLGPAMDSARNRHPIESYSPSTPNYWPRWGVAGIVSAHHADGTRHSSKVVPLRGRFASNGPCPCQQLAETWSRRHGTTREVRRHSTPKPALLVGGQTCNGQPPCEETAQADDPSARRRRKAAPPPR